MVEADIHLRMLHTSILDIYAIGMLSQGQMGAPFTIPPQIREFRVTYGVQRMPVVLPHG